ncbi:beta strand repeat-containing protein [Sphingomonas sp. Leaf4]|uniref:beta strand repeat-containing protein n=1 Tax=Sphingomonas sp. Leaf4 TaxID=2876553 RepID=UPI001E32AC2E|nr:YadA-like family protein [Sphingomonas sp. Leaf4]
MHPAIAPTRPAVSRLFLRTLMGTTMLIGTGIAGQAAAQNRVVSACSGVQLPRSVVTDILSPVVTGITGPLEGRVNSILGIPLLSTLLPLPPLNTNVTGLLNQAASGQPITLQVLDTGGNVVGPTDQCQLTTDSISLDTPAGISIGGNRISGLGAEGVASFASDINAIAFGNNARAEAGATGSIAFGTNAQVTAANSVALGAGSLATRGALGGYTAVGLTGTQTSAGEVSVGAAGGLRQITNVAAGSAATDAATVGQVAGVAGQVDALSAVALRYDDATRARATLAGAAGTVLGNVGAGAVTATSTEAVNGSQLFATNTQVAANTGAITTVQGDVTVLQGQSANAVRYDTDAAGVRTGGVTLAGATPGATVTLGNVAPAALSATSTEAVNGSQLFATNTQVAGLDTRVTTNSQNIATNAQNITTLQGQTANAVRYDTDAAGARTGGVTFIGTTPGAAVTLGNVGAGALTATSTDAVNGSQLFATNTQVATNTAGIGALDTRVTTNTTAIGGLDTRVTDNTTAIGGLDTRTTGNTTAIAGLDTRVTTNTQDIVTLQGGVANSVRYDTDAAGARTGGVTLVGTTRGATVTLGNVGAGALSATSSEAVNGSQLFATNTQVATNTAGIGALDTRVTTNTTAIGGLDTRVTDNTTAIVGNTTAIAGLDTRVTTNMQDIAALQGGAVNAVRYDTDASGARTGGVTFIGTTPGATVTLANVGAGALTATSTEAVNGAQLFATNTQVAGLDTRVTTNTQQIASLQGGVANAVRYDVDAAGNRTGGVTLVGTTPGQVVTIGNVGAGALSATSTEAVNGSQLYATNQRLDGALTSIGGLDTRVTANTAGLAALSASAAQYDNVARDRLTFGGANGTVLGNVAAGALSATSTEAVNGAQLFATNTQVAANTALIAQIGSGSAGPVRYSTAAAPTTPNGGTVTDELTLVGASGGAVALHNVRGGTVGAGSTDAVNGDQLNTTNQAVAALDTRVTGTEGRLTTVEGNVANLDTRVTNNTTQIANNTTAITNLQSNIAGTGTAVTNLTTRVDANSTAITNLQTQVGNSPIKYADAATPTTPNGGTPTDDTTLVGASGGPVGLRNVRDGVLVAGSTDAVNGGQLATTNAQVASNTSAITTIQNTITGSTVAAIQYSNPGSPTTPNGGTRTNDVTLVGANTAAPVGLHNVASGTVAAGSTDAVNGGQLFAVAQQSSNSLQYDRNAAGQRTNQVTLAGGNAAAPVTLANVAAGTVSATSTQAVNGSQLYATNQTAQAALALGSNSVQYDPSGNVSLGNGNTPVALRNVAAGTAATDAVNLGQLQSGMRDTLSQATSYIDARLTDVGFDLGTIRRDMSAGSSAAMAVAALPQAMEPGATMVAVGGGTYRGQSAIAFGASRVFNDGRAVVKVGGTYDSRGYAGANAGVGFQF